MRTLAGQETMSFAPGELWGPGAEADPVSAPPGPPSSDERGVMCDL
jgi:hypothetical protein